MTRHTATVENKGGTSPTLAGFAPTDAVAFGTVQLIAAVLATWFFGRLLEDANDD